MHWTRYFILERMPGIDYVEEVADGSSNLPPFVVTVSTGGFKKSTAKDLGIHRKMDT